MSRAGGLSLSILVAAVLTCACGDPPEKEMAQAQGAIDAARATGADEYAHEEFGAAQEALLHAHEAVDQHDYRLALNFALDSRTQAQNAAKNAADQKAKARADADHALTAAATALDAAQLKLRAAENASHVPLKTIAEGRRAVADGEEAVQKARTALERGAYRDIPDALKAPTAALRAAGRELDAATLTPARRRR
jgi:hypothetical protein